MVIFFHKFIHGTSGLTVKVGLRVPKYAFSSRTHFVPRYIGVCDPLARCVTVANKFSNRLDFFLDHKSFWKAAGIL